MKIKWSVEAKSRHTLEHEMRWRWPREGARDSTQQAASGGREEMNLLRKWPSKKKKTATHSSEEFPQEFQPHCVWVWVWVSRIIELDRNRFPALTFFTKYILTHVIRYDIFGRTLYAYGTFFLTAPAIIIIGGEKGREIWGMETESRLRHTINERRGEGAGIVINCSCSSVLIISYSLPRKKREFIAESLHPFFQTHTHSFPPKALGILFESHDSFMREREREKMIKLEVTQEWLPLFSPVYMIAMYQIRGERWTWFIKFSLVIGERALAQVAPTWAHDRPPESPTPSHLQSIVSVSIYLCEIDKERSRKSDAISFNQIRWICKIWEMIIKMLKIFSWVSLAMGRGRHKHGGRAGKAEPSSPFSPLPIIKLKRERERDEGWMMNVSFPVFFPFFCKGREKEKLI